MTQNATTVIELAGIAITWWAFWTAGRWSGKRLYMDMQEAYEEDTDELIEQLEQYHAKCEQYEKERGGKIGPCISREVIRELEKKIDNLLESITDDELEEWAHQHQEAERPHVTDYLSTEDHMAEADKQYDNIAPIDHTGDMFRKIRNDHRIDTRTWADDNGFLDNIYGVPDKDKSYIGRKVRLLSNGGYIRMKKGDEGIITMDESEHYSPNTLWEVELRDGQHLTFFTPFSDGIAECELIDEPVPDKIPAEINEHGDENHGTPIELQL